MAWASSAPAARTAIVNKLTAALPTSTVYNGQVVTGALVTEAVTVGYQDPNTPISMSGQFVPEGYASSPDRETYTISCAITVATGADDYLPILQRAFDMLGTVGQALAADPTLGGLVLSAGIGPYSVSEDLGQQSTVVTLAFGVTIDAYTSV